MERFRNARQPDWGWWARLWPAPGETLRRLGVRSGDALAEVCSGNGYFALPAARIVEPAPVYAIDVDGALLEELRSLAELQAIENVVPVRGDARRLRDHLPTSVDAVLLANVLHGVDDREGLVREAYEALRPGGRLIVVNWIDRPREETTLDGEPRGPPTEVRLSPADARDAVLRGARFSPAEPVDLPPYHYGVIFER